MTVVTTKFSGRTFNTQEMRTVIPRIAPRGPAPCAAEAVFAETKAFLSSREAREMSEGDLERELHRRRQELVRKLLQEHRGQRSPREAAGPVEGASAGGGECSERREHERHTETTSRTVQIPRPGCAPRGHDGLHPLDAALNLPLPRYRVEVRRRMDHRDRLAGTASHAAAVHSTRHHPHGRPRASGHVACGTRRRVNRKGPIGIGPVDRRTCTVHLRLPRLDLPFSHQRNGPEFVDGIGTPAFR